MRSREHFKAKFVKLDTKKCEACWKCFESCSKEVIGKVDFFFHKHAKISKPDNCSGCLKCVKVCEYEALKPVNL